LTAILNFFGPAAVWGLGAALPAVTAEYLYRTMNHGTWWLQGPWWHHLWLWAPLQLSIGYCVYRLVTIPQTSLLDAFVVFAFSTTALRVFVSVVVLGDPVKGGTWFALALLILARIAQTWWGR
jgi:hypothetical protein